MKKTFINFHFMGSRYFFLDWYVAFAPFIASLREHLCLAL